MESLLNAAINYAKGDPVAMLLLIVVVGIELQRYWLRVQSQANKRKDELESSLVTLAQGFLESMSQMANNFSDTLKEQNQILRSTHAISSQTGQFVLGMRRDFQTQFGVQLEHLNQIEKRLNSLPEDVQTQFGDDFEQMRESIGEMRQVIGEVQTQVSAVHSEIPRVKTQIDHSEERIIAATRDAIQSLRKQDAQGLTVVSKAPEPQEKTAEVHEGTA